MRAMSWSVMFTLFLSIVVLTSVRWNKQSDAVVADKSVAALGAPASSVPALVSLPGVTGLVKREGAAVVNISSTQKVSVEALPYQGVPGVQPDGPFVEFFRRFEPGDQQQASCKHQAFA